MADNMSYLYTIGGYATLFGIGYVIYQVSTQKSRKRVVTAQDKTAAKPAVVESRKDDRKKKQRMETFASQAQDTATKAANAVKSSAKAVEPAWLSNDAKDEDVDNREFARQLAKAKQGTKFSGNSEGSKQREKSVKQSRANKITGKAPVKEKEQEQESAPSSTTGADADDDQSPAASPAVGPAAAGDVSDMLEPTRSGPSVLRLTDTASKQQNKKPAKAPEQVETKRQRQNRKKAEAAKEAREEAEKDRKVLEEKQRRQARIAEGRAAKDGSQFMAAANVASKWNKGAPSTNNTPVAATNGFHQPLDTFEQPIVAPQPKTATKPVVDNWAASLPSEEEQMEMIKSDEDDWSTVKTKSSKKVSKKTSSVDSGDEPAPSRPAAQPKQPSAGAIASKSKSTQSFGSFSALTVKDAAADEDEEEEEWEV